MKKIKISMLLFSIMSMGAVELFAAYAGKTIDNIDFKNWPAKQKVMTSAKGTKIIYVDRKKTVPKIDTGIMLPSATGAYLNIESPVLDSDFSKGLGMTIKFKLFPRNKTKKILRTLVSKYDYGTNNRCFSFMISNNNQLQFAVSKDGVKLIAVGSKIKLEDEKEYIATAIFHPAQTLELYLNGALIASKNINIKKIFKGKCDLRAGSRADKSRPAQILNGIIYNLDFFIPAIGSSKKKRLTNTRPNKSKSPLPGVTGIAIPFSNQNRNWQSALKQDALTLPGYFFKAEGKLVRGKIAKLQSTVKAVYLSDALVLSVHCPITNMKAAIAAPKNNSIEFCIDPNNGDQTLFAVKVQIDGKVSSAFIASCDYVQKTWRANAQTKVTLNPDSYDVMIKIPYKSFGMKLSQGDIIGLAVSITRKTNSKSAMTTWPNRKAFWTWWQRRRIPDPFFFADILLAPKKGYKLKFISTTRGALLAKGADAENSFAGEFSNSGTTKENVNIEAFIIKNGSKKVIINRHITIHPKSSLPIRFSYPGDISELNIIAKTNNTSLYQTRLTRRLDIPQRIHDIGGSFMPEMIKKVKQPLAKQGFIIYPQHLKGREGANQSATQFAYAYDMEKTIAAMSHVELPNMTVRTETDYNNLTAKAKSFRKYGIKVAYYPSVHRIAMAKPKGLSSEPYMVNVSKRTKTNRSWDFKALPSEGFSNDYFIAMKQDLNKYGDIIYALMLPDEFDYSFIKAMKIAFSTPDNQRRNSLIMKIHEDIKKRFGGGRYGLYNNSMAKADKPYCTIAMHRWLNDWIAKFIRKVAAKARALKPGIKIISDDPQGMVFPYDYRRRWNGVVDIVIHQTHDKCMPQDIGTAVVCKFVKDVSGVEEFWPCVHVEGSSSVFSLDETREEFSRAFRNGATGVALFNLAWGGALGFREEIGAPERWNYIRQIAAFYGKGFRAKLPEKADVGVFFSNYSTMADYARGLGYVYMYLGPATNGYFKFFDDYSLERGDVSAADYKVVFVHHAKYESPGAVKKLLEAVRDKGITLVITDPHAFSKDGVGKAIAERDDLFGSTQVAESKGYATVVPTSNSGGVFSAMKTMKVGKAWALKPDKNAITLLKYSSGEAACVSRKLGKGQVIIFGFNPFFYLNTMTLGPNAPTGFDYGDTPIADPNLAQVNVARKQFFTMLLKYLNVSLDAKIWNLKVPAWKKNTEWPAKSCLSGNSIFWSLNRPRTIANVAANGKYRCSPVPKEQEKSDKKGWVKFTDGALFDRVDTFRTGKSGKKSILTWNSSEPIAIKIDLGYLANISEVDLYLNGVYADCKIYSSKNGKEWQLAGSNRSSGKTDGVAKKRVKLKNIETQYLNIKFEAGKTQGKFIISEIDIWGEPLLLSK